jgi:pimeloyl-ACP methyl ester carboxylesterase
MFADKLTDQLDFMKTLLYFGVGNTIIETLGMDALAAPFADVPNPQPRDAFKRQVDADLAVDTLGRLNQIDKPTLVVWGDQDDIFPERHPRQLLEGIRGAKDGMIANVGHSPALENTEAFNKLVGDFISAN